MKSPCSSRSGCAASPASRSAEFDLAPADNDRLANLCGPLDENLRLVESRLGVEVRMFGVGGLVGPFTDPAVRDYALRAFGEEFHLDADAKVSAVERVADGVRVRYRDHDGSETEAVVDYVIAATGRVRVWR